MSKIKIPNEIPSYIVKEAFRASKESSLSEVYILSDGSGFLVSETSDIGVEYYRPVVSLSEGKVNWVSHEYGEVLGEDEYE